MLREDDRAAWEDAFNQAKRPQKRFVEKEPGWYITAGTVALGFIAIWALYAWVPVS